MISMIEKSSIVGENFRTTIPMGIRRLIDVKKNDLIVWTADSVNGEWVVSIKKKRVNDDP